MELLTHLNAAATADLTLNALLNAAPRLTAARIPEERGSITWSNALQKYIEDRTGGLQLIAELQAPPEDAPPPPPQRFTLREQLILDVYGFLLRGGQIHQATDSVAELRLHL